MDEDKINETAEPDGCGHTDEEHEQMAGGGGGMPLLDMLTAITGERPVLVRDGYPFVVVQMTPSEDLAPDTGYGLDISAGCVPNRETMAAMLVDTVVQMNGLTREDEEALLTMVDRSRTAAGMRSLTDYAFTDVPDEEPAAEPAEPEPAKN